MSYNRSNWTRRDTRPLKKAFRQPKRRKTLPVPAKPCYVVTLDDVKAGLAWNAEEKYLYFNDSTYQVFPSRKKAKIALWHTCQMAAKVHGVDGREHAAKFMIVEGMSDEYHL